MLKSFLKTFPPVFVLFLTAFAYYSYVCQFCFFLVISVTKKCIYIFFFNLIIIMFLWCFFNAMCKIHDPIPHEYRLSSNEHSRLLTYSEDQANEILKKIVSVRGLEIYTVAPSGKVRYCNVCKVIKPDRTHHCSTCERCILKMDHHCPWIYNCVGHSNYKQFILMLFYATILCLFYDGTVAEYIVNIGKNFEKDLHKLTVGIGFLVATVCGLFIFILLFYHMSILLRNETTLEALRETTFRIDNATFDSGPWYNFTQVFGYDICCWLIPTGSSEGNGYEFKVNQLIP